MDVKITDLIGKKITRLSLGQDSDNLLTIDCETYENRISDYGFAYQNPVPHSYRFYHPQDCCESVYLESVDGDLLRLLGQTIVEAYESTNSGNDERSADGHYLESFTWTFYVIRTNLDSVTLRFLGSSNGYYSESVYISKS